MKIIFIGIFILLPHLSNAQSPEQVIKQHYDNMDSLWNLDKYTELIQYIKDVESFFKKNNKPPAYDYYRLLVNYLGETLVESGQYEEAEKTLLESLEIINPFGKKLHPAYNDALCELGRLYMVSGRYSKAYYYYTEAWKSVDFWRKIRWGKYIEVGNYLINICANIGKYQDAEFYANKIEESIPAANYTNEELVDYYITRSILYIQMMSVHKAELYILKANKLLQGTAPNIFTEVELKNILSMTYMASGRKDSAEKILTDVIMKLEKMKMKNTDPYYLSVANLASIFFVNKQNKMADSLITNVLSGVKNSKNKFVGALYMNLAMANLQATSYNKALANIDTALLIISANAPDELQYTLPAEIIKSIILLKVQRDEESLDLYNNVMDNYIKYIRNNISYLSESEKNGLMMSYYNMANFAPSFITNSKSPVSDKRLINIWEQQLFFKGLAAKEQTNLNKQLQRNSDTTVKSLYKELLELRQFLKSELQKPELLRNKNLSNISLLAEEKEKQLIRYLPDLKNERLNGSIEKIFKNLRPGEAIVDFTRYMRFSSAKIDSIWYAAYVLRYDNLVPAFINISSEDRITGLLETRLTGIDPKNQLNMLYPPDLLNKKHNYPGNQLYSLIWEPIQTYLKGIKTVYIIADGLLYKVAFHTLPLDNGGYLCDKIDIRYLYNSYRICDSNFRKSKKPSGVQLWGGIRYDTVPSNLNAASARAGIIEGNTKMVDPGNETDKEYLPGTLKEVDAIGKLCKSSGVPFEIFSGAIATELAFKQNFDKNFDVVHIATHGQFDSGYFFRQPGFSLHSNLPFTLTKDPMSQVELFMAGCNYLKNTTEDTVLLNDGILNASEISHLNGTDKQLIILSACESGTGDIISAEGVFGMVRAFKIAGADKIIISLWDVDDELTKEMMLVLYKSLFNGMSINEAFKHAQQYIRKKRSFPYYWAGFVLVE